MSGLQSPIHLEKEMGESLGGRALLLRTLQKKQAIKQGLNGVSSQSACAKRLSAQADAELSRRNPDLFGPAAHCFNFEELLKAPDPAFAAVSGLFHATERRAAATRLAVDIDHA